MAEPWFECLHLHVQNNTLRVLFPHAFFSAWFDQHKRAIFEDAVRTYYSGHEAPHIVYVKNCWHSKNSGQEEALPEHTPHVPAITLRATETFLTNEFSLTNFICNAKNAFPLAIAEKIAEAEAGSVHSLFLLCGDSGTGKTHLLKAISSVFARRYGRENVIYSSAAQFFAKNITPLERRKQLRPQCRALFLDDLQNISGDTAAQLRCITCLDTLPPDRQLAFAYGGSARSLKLFDERLRSRLESGLVVEVTEPDLDVRLRYLQAASKERGLVLSRQQLLFLAQRCMRFPLLYGMLRKVEAFATLHKRVLTPADMENIVRSGGVDKNPGCREILAAVARDMNLRPEDILGHKRRPDLVLARQTAMYICRKNLGLSYPELGRAFGGRDHSTVIHAVKKIQKLLVSNKDMHRLVTELEQKTL